MTLVFSMQKIDIKNFSSCVRFYLSVNEYFLFAFRMWEATTAIAQRLLSVLYFVASQSLIGSQRY